MVCTIKRATIVGMKILEHALRWIALAGIFALPFIVFIVASSFFFPFITGKNFTFRIIVEVMTGAWLALALVFPKYRPRRSWMLLAFSLFVLVMAIADAQGVNPFKSFWSNYERMDGWVTLAHLLAYFTVAVSMLNTEKLWQYLWHTSLGVSVLVSGYGLLQLAGLATINQGGVRLDATFGNATYLAVYMLFNIAIAAFYLARAWTHQSEWRTALAWIYGGIMALDFVILFFTATRGALLGLLGGAVLAGILLIVQSPRSRIAWRAGVGVGLAALLALGFFFVRDASWIRNIGPLDRLASISLSDGTTASRFMNMGMALKGFEEKPLLGWGQENYAIVFDKFYNPGMYAQEPWFDRVHNIVFDWLVAGGLLGLIGYLSLYACALWCLWRGGAFNHIERSILTGLLAGYFFYLLFTFDNVTSYILFITLLAFIAWRASEHADTPRLAQSVVLPHAALAFTTIATIMVVTSVGWYTNAAAMAQNRALLRAVSLMNNPAASFASFETALSHHSVGDQEVREQLAQIASSMASNTSIPLDIKQKFVERAVSEMRTLEKVSPLDARFPLFLGIIFTSYGDNANAVAALQKAHELSPGKQTILFQLASLASARGDTSTALEYWKQAFDLFPGYREARAYYAVELIRARKDAEAEALLAPIIASGEAADARIASVYAERGRYDKIIAIWEAHISAQPSDMQAYFTLAAAYYAANNSGKAIATLELAKKQNPAVAPQVDQFITQIKNGTVGR